MAYNVERYLARKKINASHILYLTRETPHTMISLFNGEKVATTIPLKEFALYLPQEEFVNITKGVLLRKRQVVHISDDGRYTMADGTTFQGRTRNSKQHKQLRQTLLLPDAPRESAPLGLLEKCSLMDDMPLAFCVIELVFNADGHGVDFIFRYCNREMEALEGFPIKRMVNRSFYEVFQNGDKKWLITYADVALNGSKRVIRDFSPEIEKELTIHCFQPVPGYCACVLLPS